MKIVNTSYSLHPLLWVMLIAACKTPLSTNSPHDTTTASGKISPSSPLADTSQAFIASIPYHPLINEDDLELLVDEIADARIVLLGEASHGTNEYYTWRAALSKKLIEQKGFRLIAVEGDWTYAERVNAFIKGERRDSLAIVKLLKQYKRWPTWLWANEEFASFVDWLDTYDHGKVTAEQVNFFGLDVYDMYDAAEAIASYSIDTALEHAAAALQQCLQPYKDDALSYTSALMKGAIDCRQPVGPLWQALQRLIKLKPVMNNERLAIEQNAMVAIDGEDYFRTMATNRAKSWNIRDRHMKATVKRLLQAHAPNAKMIIWAHNTHVGDAQQSDMPVRGKTNLAELLRKDFGAKNVYIVGFGSYTGTVIAADEWGAAYKKMEMLPAEPKSWEGILHHIGPADKIVLSRDIQHIKQLDKWVDQRTIGAVYHPTLMQYIYHIPSRIPTRYNAFVFIDVSHALHPL